LSDLEFNDTTNGGRRSGQRPDHRRIERLWCSRRSGITRAAEVFRKISQNFSPAVVRSPFVARAMPMDTDSVRCKRHASRTTPHKFNADFILQVFRLPAQRGLRDSKLRSGLGEVRCSTCCQKIP
jgi:hypothetical protein